MWFPGYKTPIGKMLVAGSIAAVVIHYAGSPTAGVATIEHLASAYQIVVIASRIEGAASAFASTASSFEVV
jgi:hypothetical protein